MSGTDAAADQVTDRHATTDSFAVATMLLAIIADPGAAARRMADLKSALQAVSEGETKLAADREAFEQHERTTRAELSAREKRLAAEEEKLAARKAEVDGRDQGFAERQRELDEQASRLKGRMMRILNLERHPLGDMPSFTQLDMELSLRDADPHFGGPEGLGAPETIEHAPAAATIRRTRPRHRSLARTA